MFADGQRIVQDWKSERLLFDIASVVASLTESEPHGESEELQSHAWLTGTAARGGQAVGLLSLSSLSFPR